MATSLSLADFRIQFPEFGNLPDPLVSQRIAWAEMQMDSAVWGDIRSIGIGFLVAHFCALSPRAEDMRLQKDKGNPTTFYEIEYSKLVRMVAGGARVAVLRSEHNAIVAKLRR